MPKGAGDAALAGEGPDPVEDPRADLRYRSVPRLLSTAARSFGDEAAIEEGGERLSFSELEERARQFARACLVAGIGQGDRVAIWAPNSAKWVIAALGALGSGAVLVPVNTRFKGPEAADVIGRSGARLLVSVGRFLGTDYLAMLGGEAPRSPMALERVVVVGEPGDTGGSLPWDVHEFDDFMASASEADADLAASRWDAVEAGDLSDIIFTSGTTGRPKGAMATHAQTLRAFGTWSSIVGLERGDRYLVVNPFFHTFGYKAGIIACLITGATILPEAVFDPARVLERLLSDGVTVLPGPPALYSALLEGLRMSPEGLLVAGEGAFSGLGLRLAVTGAAVVPVELVRRMREELGCHTVLTAYGLTEATGVVTMCRRGDPPEVVASTSGRAIPGVEVEVRDEGGRAVAPGELGEVVVRGYNVSPGYFEDPAASAEAIDQEGWLHTGDIGVMDEQGNLRICDRLKDMYVVGGFNAYPAEIEQVLVTHPAVASVAVVGVPDERLGEVGAAFVVPRAGCDRDGLEESLIEFARSRMANYKVPRRVVVVDALPLNASGKVLKMHLREMAFETGAGRGSAERSNA